MNMEDATDPYDLFGEWFVDAAAAEPRDPNAMALATATPDGFPTARMVLLKAYDRRGFAFYSNTESRKGGELAANPRAAICFHWKSLNRQVRIEGGVTAVSRQEADAYFATRPRDSQLGAWASPQSRPLDSRATLERRVMEAAARYPTEVPRPDYWTGYLVAPSRFEFWHDRPFRLHDRICFTADGAGWTRGRLYP